jgi:hypothetical protein
LFDDIGRKFSVENLLYTQTLFTVYEHPGSEVVTQKICVKNKTGERTGERKKT